MKEIKALRGFKDVTPEESYRWQYIEAVIRDVTAVFGYREERSPVIEQTELFARGVGDSTDIVQKEMYTFTTKGDDMVTLKPEGTAGAVRQFIEHRGYTGSQPTRMYYLNCPVFRYEKPQAGRLREHHQFGIECFGSSDPVIDAEVLLLATTVFSRLNVTGLSLHINNIGCPNCRPQYNEALRSYFSEHIDTMCDDCKTRLEINPLRILDCKQEGCRKIIENAPRMSEYVCDECSDHFSALESYLQEIGLDYVVDERLVRGLDYYTRMVFELISEKIGAQGTVCGGGRYDGLVEELGGPSVPGAGFGMGMERLLLQLESQGIEIPMPPPCKLYIANMGDAAKRLAWKLSSTLRQNGIAAEMDSMGRSMRAQFKYADKISAAYVLVIGESELNENKAVLRNMADGSERDMALDTFVDEFSKMDENTTI